MLSLYSQGVQRSLPFWTQCNDTSELNQIFDELDDDGSNSLGQKEIAKMIKALTTTSEAARNDVKVGWKRAVSRARSHSTHACTQRARSLGTRSDLLPATG